MSDLSEIYRKLLRGYWDWKSPGPTEEEREFNREVHAVEEQILQKQKQEIEENEKEK